MTNLQNSSITNAYNSGYSDGRAQGQNDVAWNPNAYGLYTASQYTDNYTNGYNAGRSSVSPSITIVGDPPKRTDTSTTYEWNGNTITIYASWWDGKATLATISF